jgi:hypothetical protein
MRAYFFCNYYLSSIQQGIQSAHCLAEMFVDYTDPWTAQNILFEWAQNHKTMVVLNGGNSENVLAIYAALCRLCDELEYPYGVFKEDTASLNSAYTCTGVIVPEKIYKYNEYEQERHRLEAGPLGTFGINPITLNTAEKELAAIIASAPLAR